MARINIEEKWWSDPRRGRLIRLVGPRVADGLMLEAWRLAQEFNGEPFNGSDYFDKAELEHMSSCGLATLEQGLVYVKGSKQHHSWLLSRREAASRGGKKSAQLRQATLEQTSSKSKQIQPSYSISNSNNKTKNKNTPQPSASALVFQQRLEEIIKHLNLKSGREYRTESKKTQLFLKRLFAERVTVDEVKLVIDAKCKEWLGTDRAIHLNPHTLFGEKFLDIYLPNVKATPTKPAVERDQFGNVRL